MFFFLVPEKSQPVLSVAVVLENPNESFFRAAWDDCIRSDQPVKMHGTDTEHHPDEISPISARIRQTCLHEQNSNLFRFK
jgi:hypothetical protein